MDQNNENQKQSAKVNLSSKQAEEATPPAWWWVERSVWTEAMLTRLTSKEPANRVWYTLVDKTYNPANLQSAYEKVKRNGGSAGVDGQTLSQFERRAPEELRWLVEQLRRGSYRPQPVRRTWIDKPGSTDKRPLGIPVVRDRIVQGALRQVLEPIMRRSLPSNRMDSVQGEEPKMRYDGSTSCSKLVTAKWSMPTSNLTSIRFHRNVCWHWSNSASPMEECYGWWRAFCGPE